MAAPGGKYIASPTQSQAIGVGGMARGPGVQLSGRAFSGAIRVTDVRELCHYATVPLCRGVRLILGKQSSTALAGA